MSFSNKKPVELAQVSISSQSRRSTKTDIMNVLIIEGYINR